MKIVALDPGETTGYAVYDTETGEVSAGEVMGNFRRCVNHILGLGDLFVVESFRVRPGKGAALARLPRLWPVEWMGALRYCLEPDQLVFQTPAQGKGMMRGAVEGGSVHESDALCHLFYYLNRQGIKAPVRIISPEELSEAIEEALKRD